MASQHGTQAVDRAADLLSLVVLSGEPVSFTGLVTKIGLARSTTSRLLQSLERNRLLSRARDGGYVAGPLFTLYATRHDSVDQLVDLAQPSLDRLGEHTRETVNLSIPRDDVVVQVAQVESRYVLGSTNWVGVDVPAHCSAMGKVFYAYGALGLPPGPLERRTQATITSKLDLERDLDRVRRRGYGISDEELESGLMAIAAPVRSGDGAVTAAISVSGPTPRMHDGMGKIITDLIGETQGLSEQLGYDSRKEGVA
jgi:IclR family transcriptional regulator, acetate operon repressor